MRRVIFAAVNTVVGLIMLLSFKTHAAPTTLATPPAAISGASPTTTTVGSATPTGPASSSGSASNTATTPMTRTVTGGAAQTRYGPVSVQITVTGGKITAVDAVEYPTAKARDREINAKAVPQLDREVLAVQSAKIDMVSGATYTSRGYIASLQSALDSAGLA